MKRFAALAGVVAVAFVAVMLLASPAGATFTVDDAECAAEGTFAEEGTRYPAEVDKIVVPLEDTVVWSASVLGGGDENGEGPSRTIEGKVTLKTPWGEIGVFDLGSWGPREDNQYSSSGEYTYSFPSVVGGAKLTLTGEHFENGTLVCEGEVEVELDGGGFSNPLTYASLGLLAVSGIGFVIAVKP